MMETAWSRWPAPAKLNLFLRITGRRADGYHLLQTCFRLLDWGDTVHLRVRSDGRLIRHEAAAGIAEAEDLGLRAAQALREASGSRLGADIRVEKRVPIGGGLGGGSSDAATVLCALDRLWETGLGEDRLATLGLGLGADVPVFVRGRNAWAEGVGERLTPVLLPERWYLLADPGVRVATAQLFQAPDLTRDAPQLKIADFVRDGPAENAFEPVLRRRYPAIAGLLEGLDRFGQARVTGSGGVCFVELETQEQAQAALRAWDLPKPAWIVRGAARSALLDALD